MARFALLTAFAAILCSPLAAATPTASKSLPTAIDMFEAMASGQVTVQLIPKDATQANFIVRNKTDQPVNLRLPDAFVGVPVLAQRGGGLGGGGGGGGQQSFGGGGGGLGGGGGGGGFFQVAPGAMKKAKVTTVCLEHGKKDPNPRVPYEIKPISSFTKDQRVHEVCKLLGSGKLDQHTAQAAAWHLTDGLSWNELAQKVKIKHLNGSTEMFFNQRQVASAARVVAMVASVVDTDNQPATTPVSKSAFSSAE